MAEKLYSESSFIDKNHSTWQLSIYKETDSFVTTIYPTIMANGLSISWDAKDIGTAIHGSRLTVNFLSTEDRQFLNLYTTDALSTRCELRRYNRDGEDYDTYWQGMLDTESYEEPFYQQKNYSVELSFTDIAPLQRVKFSGSYFKEIGTFIEDSLKLMRYENGYYLPSGLLDDKLSTLIDGDTPLNAQFLSDNFYDSDGDADTIYEVIESVLVPLGAHLIQRNGSFHVYDLNALYDLTPQTVELRGADSMLSMKKVYNNIEIDFDPNEDSTLLSDEVTYDEIEALQMDSERIPTGGGLYPQLEYNTDVYVTDKGLSAGNVILNKCNHYVFDGKYGDYTKGYIVKGEIYKKVWDTDPVTGEIFYDTWTFTYAPAPNTYVNTVTQSLQSLIKVDKLAFYGYGSSKINTSRFTRSGRILNFSCSINCSLLFDPTGDTDDKTNYEYDSDHFKSGNTYLARIIKAPYRLRLYAADGVTVAYHYINGLWVAGDYTTNWNYFRYVGTTNAFNSFQTLEEEVKTPPTIGWLSLEIGNQISMPGYSDADQDGEDDDTSTDEYIDNVHWILVKDLSVDIKTALGQDIDTENQVFTKAILDNAEESVSIDTKLGTVTNITHTAKGGYFTDGAYAMTFERNGVVDDVEELLINTIVQNYKSRMPILTGTTKIVHDFTPFEIPNLSGTYYVSKETLYPTLDRSEMELTAFTNDTDNDYMVTVLADETDTPIQTEAEALTLIETTT